jgi:hypothetical protein
MDSFETSRSEQEVFDDLETLCSSPGYIHALAFISQRDNLVSYDGALTGEAMAASYAPQRTMRTEFSTLMGLMLKHPIDYSLPEPQKMQELIDQTHALLHELHICLNAPMMATFKRVFAAQQSGLSIEDERPFKNASELREPIFMAGSRPIVFSIVTFPSTDTAWTLIG